MKALGLDWEEVAPRDPVCITNGGNGAVMYIQELYNGRRYWALHDFLHDSVNGALVVEGVAASKKSALNALRREYTKWKLTK